MRNRGIAISFICLVLAACGGGGVEQRDTSHEGSENRNQSGEFALTIKWNGVLYGSPRVTPGGSETLWFGSGDELEISSSAPVTWNASLNGVSSSVKSITPLVWNSVLRHLTSTTVTITATAVADPAKSASVTLDFYGRPPFAKLGDSYTYAITSTLNDGSITDRVISLTVSDVTPDNNNFVFDEYNGTNQLTERSVHDIYGNTLSALSNVPGSVLCTYAPAETLLTYPMRLGQTYNATWTNTCGSGSRGYFENGALTGTPLRYELVTIPAGTFNALKVQRTQMITDSTDPNLAASPTKGFRIDETCWVDVNTGRNVKCMQTRTWSNAVPANYLTSRTVVLTSFTKH
jgi:hypothetical protein